MGILWRSACTGTVTNGALALEICSRSLFDLRLIMQNNA